MSDVERDPYGGGGGPAPPARPVPPAAATPPKDRSGRLAWWVLGSVVVGFMLPTVAFVFVLVGLVGAIGSFGFGPTLPPTAFGDAVAIVRVEGGIYSTDDPADFAGGAGSGVVLGDLGWALDDPAVKAIVLRVDSPGGSVTGSAQIEEAIRAADKPVVASMAGVAASGGYYVSAPADLIVARPDTITGSIGVIMTLFNAEGLLEELGVEVTAITSGPNKDLGSLWSELTPAQRRILEGLIDESYREFVRVIVDGRGMTEAEVLALADGRVYTGRQALDVGLVDELGDLDHAIARAAELGGIEGEPEVIEYPRPPSLSSLLAGLESRLRLSRADEVAIVLERFMSPVLEYRYLGPGGG